MRDGYLLLVEDNPGDAWLTRSLLDEADQGSPELRWVPSIQAATQALAQDPDCVAVLLDLGLPDSQALDGLAAILPFTSDFPIIVLTGDGSESLGTQAVAAGAQDFLVKGRFDAGQLQRSIRFARQRKRIERRERERERQAALDAAIAVRDELNDVLSRIDDGFVALDLNWRYTYANPQAARLMRHARPEDVVGRLLWDEYPDLAGSPTGAALRAVMATQTPEVAELFFPPWDRWFEIRMHPSRNGLTLYFSDITERRLSEKAILDFQLELSQLAQQLLTQERTTTKRVAQVLHDRVGQTLAVARLSLDACVSAHQGSLPAALGEQAARIGMLLDQAVSEARDVLAELRPPYLEDSGLAAALDNEIRARGAGSANVDLLLELGDGLLACRWPDEVEHAAFMVAREAIANALLHAGATLIRVVVGGDPQALKLEVIDDGKGIAQPLLRGRPGHLGIVGMRERCIAIGARFAVANDPAGGTCVSLRWEAAPR